MCRSWNDVHTALRFPLMTQSGDPCSERIYDGSNPRRDPSAVTSKLALIASCSLIPANYTILPDFAKSGFSRHHFCAD